MTKFFRDTVDAKLTPTTLRTPYFIAQNISVTRPWLHIYIFYKILTPRLLQTTFFSINFANATP